MNLSHPQRGLLWRVAQFKYGQASVSRNAGGLQVADALVRRGLVEYVGSRESFNPIVGATGAGREEIMRRWPVSPFILRTYEHQPGGWTAK